MRLLTLSLLLFSLQAFAQGFPKEKAAIEIDEPWARATTPGTTLAAGYMTLRNKSDDRDRLLSVSSPLARKVETHITLKEGDIMRMREVPGYEVPGRGRVELKPGGAHLMFVDIKRPFKAGEKIPVTLSFDKAGEMNVELEVRAAGAAAGDAGEHKMH